MSQSPLPAQELLRFIKASPTPFHAVESACALLRAAAFQPLAEADAWSLRPGGRYFVTRNGSTVGAFIVGTQDPSAGGFHLIGAHTDSPNLRLKPEPELERSGYRQLGVEIYGGALLATWTDRDLGLAGRVVVVTQGRVESRLVHFDRPLARVPQLAIHLDREVNERGLILNRETQMVPVIGLTGPGATSFVDWLAAELSVPRGAILGHELMLFDLAPPVLSGLGQEFIHAARLDNQASCHAALSALIGAAATECASTRGIVLYDNEEVGSATSQGAGGPFLGDLLERIGVAAGLSGEGLHRARARSFFISADMAHAVHPNYADRHDPRHAPALNGGPVIKVNTNARYATDSESGAIFARLAAAVEVPVQRYTVRADLPCGSTIGPIVATRLGLKTVDVGNPMLSMHSCREMSGAKDHDLMIRVLSRFFQEPGALVR